MHTRAHFCAAALVAAALTSACTGAYQGGGPPTVMLDTPLGPPEVIAGGGLSVPPGGGLAAPPTGLDTVPPTSAPRSRNGVYAGTAVPLDTGGGACIQNKEVSGFRVRGTTVRWGGFRGTIAPDNGVQMAYGTTWVTGQFIGEEFQGQITMPGRLGAGGCTYMMSLQKVGA